MICNNNNIVSILDLWGGHKTCRLIPAALEKNSFFKEDFSPSEDRLQGKYDCILF